MTVSLERKFLEMRRFLLLMLTLSLVFSLAACGGTAAEQGGGETPAGTGAAPAISTAPTAAPSPETDGGIQVDEGLLTVEITMPASFFEDMTADEIKAAAEEEGYKACEINADGSVTYTMSKAKHREALADFKASVDEAIEEMISGEEAVASFRRIEYNNNFSRIDVYVDSAAYTTWDAFSGLAFYVMGAYYQILSGDDPDAVDVVVNFIDEATDEVIHTMSYREFMEASAEADAGAGDTAADG